MTATAAGYDCIGFLEGWRGIVEGNTMPLSIENTRDIIYMGGTILGSSRTNPYKTEGDRTMVEQVIANFEKFHLDALVAVGGDDTLGVAAKLYDEEGLNVVGVPKTIDNDLSCTDVTFGFDTAVNISTDAIDRIRTTAESHRRCLVVEVMGRHAGWIAAYAGVASGADAILVPEVEVNVQKVCDTLKKNRAAGKLYNIVVVSEGATLQEGTFVTKDAEIDAFGHVKLGGVGKTLAKMIEESTGYETREVILGHTQRGGNPTALDRVLGTRFGIAAANLVTKGDFGKMVALRGTDIVADSLAKAAGVSKVLTEDFIKLIDQTTN
jgi:6-phosphofructokinase 1